MKFEFVDTSVFQEHTSLHDRTTADGPWRRRLIFIAKQKGQTMRLGEIYAELQRNTTVFRFDWTHKNVGTSEYCNASERDSASPSETPTSQLPREIVE